MELPDDPAVRYAIAMTALLVAVPVQRRLELVRALHAELLQQPHAKQHVDELFAELVSEARRRSRPDRASRHPVVERAQSVSTRCPAVSVCPRSRQTLSRDSDRSRSRSRLPNRRAP